MAVTMLDIFFEAEKPVRKMLAATCTAQTNESHKII